MYILKRGTPRLWQETCALKQADSSLPRFDLVVPVFNEEESLPEFFRRLRALALDFHPVFVDNASTDGSLKLLKSWPGATVIEHEFNEGYGGSLIDGMVVAKTDYIIVIDADCEFPPESIPEILQALKHSPVVYASRFYDRDMLRHANMPLIKRLGNKLFSWLYNSLFGQSTTDLYTGCKGIQRTALNGIEFEHKGFEHVLELAVKLALRGQRIVDVPVRFSARSSGSSKMRYISDSGKYFYLLMGYALKKWRGQLQA